jgi:UDP:flavonoid glycosyltransferase YjiC (YdhE family)
VLVISPPFYSHARVLAGLGYGLAGCGAHVVFACIPELAYMAEEHRLDFYPFEASSNRNTANGRTTEMPREDAARLQAHMDASRRSAAEALIVGARNFQRDMLGDPQKTTESVAMMVNDVTPDWCLIDQLSFPVTLALYCLDLPFASVLPGHPTDLPPDDQSFFGLPRHWPAEVRATRDELAELQRVVKEVDRTFTDMFNETIATIDAAVPLVERAFGLSSRSARVFNYPEAATTYPFIEGNLFAGHVATGTERLTPEWTERLAGLDGRPRVLVAFGTFHWWRTDVMRIVHEGVRKAFPSATFVISAGESTAELSDIANSRTVVADFVPQRALLPHFDLAVHHAASNSFNEATLSSVPSIGMPLAAANQFAVAHDISRLGVGRVMDANRLTSDDIAAAASLVLSTATRSRVAALGGLLRSHGPDRVGEELIARMADLPHRARY